MVVEATPPETVPEDVLPTTDDAVTIEMETDDPVPVSADDDTVVTDPIEPAATADDDTVDAAPAGPSVAVAAPVELSISNAAPAEPMIVDATPTEKIEMNNTDITVTRDTAMEDPVPICTTDGNVPADDGVDAIDASVTRDVTMEDPEPVAITGGGGGAVGTTVQRPGATPRCCPKTRRDQAPPRARDRVTRWDLGPSATLAARVALGFATPVLPWVALPLGSALFLGDDPWTFSKGSFHPTRRPPADPSPTSESSSVWSLILVRTSAGDSASPMFFLVLDRVLRSNSCSSERGFRAKEPRPAPARESLIGVGSEDLGPPAPWPRRRDDRRVVGGDAASSLAASVGAGTDDSVT
ncbi:hypothetical protein HG531_013297 [Fusarium graminearum]|nr:hypothetical protein HG531_013297 [Fusarium graminearum]